MTSSNQACSLTFAAVMLSLCAALTAVDAGATAAPADGALTVQTADGTVRGRAGKGVREFNGIPFAAPPVGDLRFAPPAPALPWQGVLDATQLRDACPQARRFNLTEASDVEDCLHLNVAVPTAPRAGTRPVLVWFYGGAFVGGSTKLYPNDFLAREGDMVVVSVNYRLGPLGWMAHPAFGAQANGGYALEDQRAALRWVQRNIAQFGGDPARVTIGGVSAGAASVCMHLISPEATTGLFHQAIIQSSGCTFTLRSLEEGKNAGLAVAKLVGCDDPATALRCLRGKPVKELVDAGTVTASSDYRVFAPIYGNGTVPRQGAEAFATGNFVRVPILNGGASYEMRLYVGYEVEAGGKIDAGNYAARLRALYGEHADKVLAAYPASRYSSPATALGTAMSDLHAGRWPECLPLPAHGMDGLAFRTRLPVRVCGRRGAARHGRPGHRARRGPHLRNALPVPRLLEHEPPRWSASRRSATGTGRADGALLEQLRAQRQTGRGGAAGMENVRGPTGRHCDCVPAPWACSMQPARTSANCGHSCIPTRSHIEQRRLRRAGNQAAAAVPPSQSMNAFTRSLAYAS